MPINLEETILEKEVINKPFKKKRKREVTIINEIKRFLVQMSDNCSILSFCFIEEYIYYCTMFRINRSKTEAND